LLLGIDPRAGARLVTEKRIIGEPGKGIAQEIAGRVAYRETQRAEPQTNLMTNNDKLPWDPDYDPQLEIDALSKRCDEYERELRRFRDANRSLGEALKTALKQIDILRGPNADQDQIDNEF
jgi:hypothetical protein